MRSRTRLVVIIILALLVPIVPFAITGELPGDRWLQAYDTDSLLFGAVGAGLLCSDILLPVPSSIIGTLLGARLGFLAGFCWTFLGLMAGSLIGYFAGRVMLPSIADSVENAPGSLIVLLSRPVPVLAESVAIAAGAARLGVVPLVVASAVGNAVYAGVLAAAGAALLPEGHIVTGLAIAMLLPVVAWAAWRYLAPPGKQP